MFDGYIVSPRLLLVLAFFVVPVLALALTGKVPLQYNFRNIIVRWRITLLTALAFTLVVGLMTFMLAFVNGMYKLTEGSGVPGNVIILADGATDELFSNLGYGDITRIHLRPDVERDETGQKHLHSQETYFVVNQPIPTRRCPKCRQMVQVGELDRVFPDHGSPACEQSGKPLPRVRQRRFLQVRGIEDPVISGQVHNLALYPGGAWFSSAGVQSVPGSERKEQAVEGVIGEGLAREFGPDQGKKSLEVGDIFDLGPQKWIVVGIMKSAGSTFDSEVWAKRSKVGDMFGKSSLTTVVLRTRDEQPAS